MSEQVNGLELQVKNVEAILEHATERMNIVEDAARQIDGPDVTVSKVFKAPMQDGGARRDEKEPEWTEEQMLIARAATHALGFGSLNNVSSGLKGAHVLVEAGLAWKYDFQETLIEAEEPTGFVYGGSLWVPGTDDELAHIKRFHGVDLEEELGRRPTQYDISRMLAGRLVAKEDFQIMPIGYAVTEGNPTIYAPTGQVQRRGYDSENRPIYNIRTDREPLTGKRYRFQPDTAAYLGFVADLLAQQGDKTTPVVGLTTQQYSERATDAIRAGLTHDRQIRVAISGRETRAKILDEPIKDDMDPEQIPGSLFVAHEKDSKLAREADAKLEELRAGRA